MGAGSPPPMLRRDGGGVKSCDTIALRMNLPAGTITAQSIRGDTSPPARESGPETKTAKQTRLIVSTSHFHPIIREWFEERFREPTEAQSQGWDAVAGGKHTLIAAPTGSGKTLAAFLTCIDRLVRKGIEGDLPDATQVVYVSPLKALSNDIQKNLAGPLEEIVALAARLRLEKR